MEKEREVVVTREQDAPPLVVRPQEPQPPVMSLEKAETLIRKTSQEHADLFRRLAE
jgi:hypothetical protein